MDSIFFHENDDMKKTFENLHNAINGAENLLQKKFNDLNNQLTIKPIEKLDSMLIHSFSCDIGRSCVSQEKYILNISKEAY